MPDVIKILIIILISYLLGSINFSLMISNKIYKEDIRKHGSGNAGATNMLRTYGKRAALFTISGDILKGIVSVFIGSLILYEPIGAYIAGLSCIIGHMFPVFYKFKGGKGVATGEAVALATNIYVFLIMLVIFVLCVAISKYVSLGSCLTAISFPILTSLFVFNGRVSIEVILCVIMVVFIVIKHHSNIKRIASKTESKISFKNKDKG